MIILMKWPQLEWKLSIGPNAGQSEYVNPLYKTGSLEYFLILLGPTRALRRGRVGPFSALVDLEQALGDVLSEISGVTGTAHVIDRRKTLHYGCGRITPRVHLRLEVGT
jgi:hypothetical protein